MKTWGFYGRNQELQELCEVFGSDRWFFCTISGRRRIGKTTLVREALARSSRPHFYFQVPDSDERGVVETFQEALEDYGVPEATAQSFRRFADVVRVIDTLCRRGVIVVIDEFQYFHKPRLADFTSLLQRVVDDLRDTITGGLVVLGSIHTEMTALLEDRRSPLFNRITNRQRVGHWDGETLFEMFRAHEIRDPSQQLFLWTLFEGVPKFHRDAFERGVLRPHPDHRRDTLRALFFEGTSPLRDEAENWFLREVAGGYESILRLVAKHGPCSLGELREAYARAGSGETRKLSAYLSTLIERYEMVEKLQPVFAGRGSRKARYAIRDNFLGCWLGAIGRNVRAARVQPLDRPLARAALQIETLEGRAWERLVRQLVTECSQKGVGDFRLTTVIEGYWNKARGRDIEIDLVALDEEDQIVRFGSCKRSEARHDHASLKGFLGHVERFRETSVGRRLSGWRVELALYASRWSPEHAEKLTSEGFGCWDLPRFEALLRSDRGPQVSLPWAPDTST